MPSRHEPLQGRRVFDLLVNVAKDRLIWLVAAPMLVVSCGFLLIAWQQAVGRYAHAIADARATQEAQAQLVDRYYRLRTCAGGRACNWRLGDIDITSVAVFEFTPQAGATRRVQFEQATGDWADETPFERGIPLLAAEFRLEPAAQAQFSQPPKDDPANWLRRHQPSDWARLQARAEDPAHWLPRLRQVPPHFSAPLRYDPDDPTGRAVLAIPGLRRDPGFGNAYADMAAYVLLFGLPGFIFLMMSLHWLLDGASDRTRTWVMAGIVLGLPLWLPFAGKAATWLLEGVPKEITAEMKRRYHEFAGVPVWNDLSVPVEDTRALVSWRWQPRDAEVLPSE